MNTTNEDRKNNYLLRLARVGYDPVDLERRQSRGLQVQQRAAPVVHSIADVDGVRVAVRYAGDDPALTVTGRDGVVRTITMRQLINYAQSEREGTGNA